VDEERRSTRINKTSEFCRGKARFLKRGKKNIATEKKKGENLEGEGKKRKIVAVLLEIQK